MTTAPARSGTSTARVHGGGEPTEAVTAGLDLALARWENEGGLPTHRAPQDETPAPPLR